MKKLLALALTLIMLFALSACGNEDVRGNITPNPDTNSSENKDDNTTEESFSLGKTNGGTYTNDYLGLTCTLPSGWEFYSEEQILALNNLTAEAAGDEIAEAINSANVIQDMYAMNSAEGCNITMALEKGTPLQVAAANLEEVTKSQISVLKSSYEGMGYTNVDIAYQKIMIDGKQYDGLRLNVTIQNLNFYGYIFSFKKGSYIASVAFGSLGADKTSEIATYFKFK